MTLNRPDPRSNMTQQQLDAAAALAVANNILFVSEMRMRLAQVRNPLKPDLPIRMVEFHLKLQDRDERVLWLLDKPICQQVAQVLIDLLDEEKGFWSESFEMEEEPDQPSPEELVQVAQEINPGTHDSIMIDGKLMSLEGLTEDEAAQFKAEVEKGEGFLLRDFQKDPITPEEEAKLAELKGTLPMGINRPEDTGEDGEFTYLKSANGEDLDD